MTDNNKQTKTAHAYNGLTWLIKCNLEFFPPLWRVSSGFVHQIQISFEWISPIEERIVMVAELLASPLVIRPFSAKLSHSSSLSFFSFLFLASSNALVFCSFDLQLLCKKYISGPFPQCTVSETVPKVSKPIQALAFFLILFQPTSCNLHFSEHSSLQRIQKVPIFLFFCF